MNIKIVKKKRKIAVTLFTMLLTSCTYNHFNEISSLCAGFNISLTATVVNTSTCDASDGSLTILATRGIRNYSFSINGGSYQSDSVFNGLKAGNYTLSVKDKNGCSASQIATINNAQSSLTISIATVPNSGCPTPNGTITVTPSGAQGTVQYQLNNGSFQPSNTFSGLNAGNYSVNAVDASNCPTSGSTTLASNGPSYKSDISPIIVANCSSCHSGNRNPNLSSYTSIKASGASIVGAINSNMPPGGKLTQQQIALITCWVNNGALNN